tara:strand:+ start:1207 stop:1491 length:285 start_codon:yes stop_codon:yes gene_type:complete
MKRKKREPSYIRTLRSGQFSDIWLLHVLGEHPLKTIREALIFGVQIKIGEFKALDWQKAIREFQKDLRDLKAGKEIMWNGKFPIPEIEDSEQLT